MSDTYFEVRKIVIYKKVNFQKAIPQDGFCRFAQFHLSAKLFSLGHLN